MLNFIRTAKTTTGLGVTADLITQEYETGIKISDDEMREAARVILDRRITRFSQSDTQPETGSADNSNHAQATATTTQEELVPLPPEAR